MVTKPLEEDSTPGTVKPVPVSLVEPVAYQVQLDAPKHLARHVHDLYFRPTHSEFEPRTLWSLTNAFTSAFKELDPIPQFKATAKLSGFLQGVRI